MHPVVHFVILNQIISRLFAQSLQHLDRHYWSPQRPQSDVNLHQKLQVMQTTIMDTKTTITPGSDTSTNFENLTFAENGWKSSDFVSKMCDSFPTACSGIETLERRIFLTDSFQARGPKDLIAIISTFLATLLGAILVKLNVLIVLSLVSIGIGKLLLIILTLKSKVFGNHNGPQPAMYEKVYYPQNPHYQREYIHELPQSYYEEPPHVYSR